MEQGQPHLPPASSNAIRFDIIIWNDAHNSLIQQYRSSAPSPPLPPQMATIAEPDSSQLSAIVTITVAPFILIDQQRQLCRTPTVSNANNANYAKCQPHQLYKMPTTPTMPNTNCVECQPGQLCRLSTTPTTSISVGEGEGCVVDGLI